MTNSATKRPQPGSAAKNASIGETLTTMISAYLVMTATILTGMGVTNLAQINVTELVPAAEGLRSINALNIMLTILAWNVTILISQKFSD